MLGAGGSTYRMNDTIKLNSSTGSLQLAATGQGEATLDGGHNHTILHVDGTEVMQAAVQVILIQLKL